jgi:hypothetical protein
LGFPIQKSPDHSLLAAPRSLSQLTTSFFAYLCLGIHTHALSSLTIKSTSHTNTFLNATLYALYTLVFIMPVNIQLSKISIASAISSNEARLHSNSLLIPASLPERMVGPDGIEPSTSPLSGVRSSHLSYGPGPRFHVWRQPLPTATGLPSRSAFSVAPASPRHSERQA